MSISKGVPEDKVRAVLVASDVTTDFYVLDYLLTSGTSCST